MSADEPRTSDDVDLAPGSSVFVRLGLDLVPGEVVDHYESSAGRRLVVALDPHLVGEDEPSTVTVPVSEAYSSQDAAEAGPPGTWLLAFTYEHAVQKALDRALRQIGPTGRPRSVARAEDHGYDFAFDMGDQSVIVQAKYLRADTFTERLADRVARELEHAPGRHKLVVSNARFPNASARRLGKSQIVPVTWRDSDDDGAIVEAIREAAAP